MEGTFQKLKSGEWGIRVTGTVTPGARVTVRKKSGETTTETVGRVVWAGGGVSLCTIADRSGAAGRHKSRGTWTGCSCGSVEEYERPGDCFTCRHDR